MQLCVSYSWHLAGVKCLTSGINLLNTWCERSFGMCIYLCSDGPPGELSSSSPASGLCSTNTALYNILLHKHCTKSEMYWSKMSFKKQKQKKLSFINKLWTRGGTALTRFIGYSSAWSLSVAVEATNESCWRWSSASTACSLNNICFKASAGPGCFVMLRPCLAAFPSSMHTHKWYFTLATRPVSSKDSLHTQAANVYFHTNTVREKLQIHKVILFSDQDLFFKLGLLTAFPPHRNY